MRKSRFLFSAGLALLLVLPFAIAPPAIAQPDIDWTVHLRGRYEQNDAPAGNPASDRDFDFSHLRARVGLDLKRGRWSFHAALQGAGSFGLPANGSFGIGPVYLNANSGDREPTDFGLVELDVTFQTDHLTAKLGRQKWGDGGETMTGVAYLDGVKKKRLAERLVGNWDWVNVGRRFEGLSVALENKPLHFAAFAFRPLQGGVNYEDAFRQFDDVTIYGATLTGRYGQLLPKAEWRVFAIEYEDDRRPARSSAGASIRITTLGASLLAGGDAQDLLLWYAYQTGDWGIVDHEAWAYIVEAGRKLHDGAYKLSGRLGIAEASGDGTPGGDHESFFNLLPTNHKWYGAIDYNAFSNLRDLYVDAVLTRGPLRLSLGLHRFELAEEADAWYGGSGAFNDRVLGYAARRPAAGRFSDDAIGHELDLSAGWTFKNSLKLEGGVSFFDGGDAAEEILTVESEGVWSYVQLSWSM